MSSWLQALKRSREAIGQSLAGVFSRKHADHEEALEDLEEALLGADLSPRLVMALIEELEEDAKLAPEEKKAHLRRALLKALPPVPICLPLRRDPW